MKKASELLGAFFDENAMKSARGYSALFSSWQSIAGERISAHSRIAELDKTILLIEADHPGWIQIIQMQQASLLEAVRNRFPDLAITGLALRLQKDTGASFREIPAQTSNAETEEDVNKTVHRTEVSPVQRPADDPYERIPEGDLQEILHKLEHSINARNRGR